jgi:hypothetical protein
MMDEELLGRILSSHGCRVPDDELSELVAGYAKLRQALDALPTMGSAIARRVPLVPRPSCQSGDHPPPM